MVIKSVPTEVREHSVHRSDIIMLLANVHWRKVLEVLDKRNVNLNISSVFVIGLGNAEHFFDQLTLR